MTITLNFDYGTSVLISARLVFHHHEWLIPGMRTEGVPVECQILKSPNARFLFGEWETASLDAYPNLFVDAFQDLAYRFLQIHEALGRGPYSKVIARPGQNQCVTYRKRADAAPAHFPAARWATVDILTSETDGARLQWGRDTNDGSLVRTAVVELLRNEIAVKAGYGLMPDAPFCLLLAMLRREGARFHNAAARNISAFALSSPGTFR